MWWSDWYQMWLRYEAHKNFGQVLKESGKNSSRLMLAATQSKMPRINTPEKPLYATLCLQKFSAILGHIQSCIFENDQKWWLTLYYCDQKICLVKRPAYKNAIASIHNILLTFATIATSDQQLCQLSIKWHVTIIMHSLLDNDLCALNTGGTVTSLTNQ